MWRWLNANSSAIQALASLAVLLVTVQLARLTGRYVALTKSIADATLEQMRMIKTSADTELSRSRDSLKALAMRTRYSLQALDKTAPRHPQLAEFSYVAEVDVQNIEALAGEIGGSITQLQAARAAISVRSILGMRSRAAAVNYRGLARRPWPHSHADAAHGYQGGLSTAPCQRPPSGASRLPISARRSHHRSAKPGLGRGYYLHPDGEGLCVSRGDHGLGDAKGPGLAHFPHAHNGLLRRRARRRS